MSTAFTYATLVTALEAFVEEDSGDEFDDNIGTIIGLGEDMLVKDLDLEMWYVIDTSKTLTQGGRVLTLPTGSLRVGDIFYTSGSSKLPLEERTYSYCVDYAPTDTEATPKYWAPYSATQIHIAPAPDSAYAVTMKHLTRPAGLSASNTTTWLGTNLGDVLLNACLVAGAEFLKQNETLNQYGKLYERGLKAAKVQFADLMRRDFSMGA